MNLVVHLACTEARSVIDYEEPLPRMLMIDWWVAKYVSNNVPLAIATSNLISEGAGGHDRDFKHNLESRNARKKERKGRVVTRRVGDAIK